jgi:hypothetical protein
VCSCGCASIDFSINSQRPNNLLCGSFLTQWRNSLGHLFGAFVFEQEGLLAGLDLWSIDGQSIPDVMPPIECLVPYGTPSQV